MIPKLCWLAGLALAGGDRGAFEAYVLMLLAHMCEDVSSEASRS